MRKTLGVPAKGKHRKVWLAVSGIAAAIVVGALVIAMSHGGVELDAHTSRQPALVGPCGAASAETVASVDANVAERIYKGELHGSEVGADVAHITGDRELGSALASSDEAAVRRAVHALVYAPHLHIVRLRVVKKGHVIADVGGPYIIAPVSGALKWQGKKVGSYVMSVQDDIGYVKLVSRFIGAGIDIYRGASFLMGTLKPAPSSVSNGQSATIAGRTYRVRVLRALAFPGGALQAALFVSKPTSTLAARNCAAVRVAAWGNIAKHVASRFNPLAAHYHDFVGTLKGATAGPVYVRIASKQIAGNPGPGPAHIPHGGTVKYRGRSWSVFSWEPAPPARVYFLTPAG